MATAYSDLEKPGVPRGGGRKQRQTNVLWLSLLAVVYLAIGIPMAYRCVNQINPDGVAYLRLARYYAEGRLDMAIEGHCSPLLSWLIAPLVRVGMPPMAAARGILLLAGLGLTLAAWLLLLRVGLSGPFRWAATICIAAMALYHSIYVLTPDLLVAAILTIYFWLSLNPSVVDQPRAAFKCGLVAGLAYLAKTYALPFFVLHFCVLMIVYARKQDRHKGLRALRAISIGLAGAAVLALPWVTIISVKYGRPTISTIGAKTYSRLRPPHLTWQVLRGLRTTQAKRLDASQKGPVPVSSWNPLANMASFKHQLHLVSTNLRYFHRCVRATARGSILPGMLFCVLLLALLATRRRDKIFPMRWGMWTVAAYTSGYIVVYGQDGRYYWPLEPVLVGLAFLLLQVLVSGPDVQRTDAPEPRGAGRTKATIAAGLLAVTFIIPPALGLRDHWITPPGIAERYVAERLAPLPLRPPLAANNWYYGLYISYYLQMKYLGQPASDEPQALAEELRSAGVGTFLVCGDTTLANALEDQPGLSRRATISLPPNLSPREVIVFTVAGAHEP